ncbi:MAG: ABC transporter permease [Chitinophagia bacterium]|jgi:ABC-2 type transport system permease protein|nr:ABC transporter permease [Chitinophagia bacterium]
MNKVSLIIQREYITRVSNKRFLLMTILMPLIFIVFIVGSAYFGASIREEVKIAIAVDPGFLKENLKGEEGDVVFEFTQGVDSLNFTQKGFDGVLYPTLIDEKLVANLHSKKQLGFEKTNYIDRQLNKAVENNLLLERGILKSTLDSIASASKENVTVRNLVSDEKGKTKESNAGLAYGIGFGSGILIYMTMFIFGSMVMRGVAEEKTNRIAEVIISSCKPFELMLGKIVGIAGVGLTQLLLWIALITALSTSLSVILPVETIQQAQTIQNSQMPPGTINNATMAAKILEAKTTLTEGVNWLMIIGFFLFYFLGGYLFYASLFAAVGSVINEDPQEAQQLMLPITMPIIFSFVILNGVLANPSSNMSVWTSIIPFTSPIIMMGRIPFGVPATVPYWQLAASMISLIGGFIFTTWFAGKIYRTGILMYGKKVTWKEMIKWTFRKS